MGAGSVGAAAAYAAFTRRIASEILLVDQDHARAEGEAMDLMHGQSLVGRVLVRAAAWEELGAADVVLVSAGANQKRGEGRLDLFARNARVMRSIVAQLDRHAPEAVVIVASNPVDLLTWVALRSSARPRARLFGTGTTLDTARFRALLGERYGVSPRSIHAYVLGEHGDSQVPVFSSAAIGSVPIADGPVLGHALDEEARRDIAERTRGAAMEIISRKGYTSLAIGLVMAHLADVVLSDQRSVNAVSVPLEGEYGLHDVCLGLPCVIGAGGVVARLTPALADDELDALRRSAEVLRARMTELYGRT